MIQYSPIFTMEGEYELVCDLSNGATSSDLERILTLFSRSHHYLMLNMSQTATETAIVTMEDTNRKPHPSFRMAPVSMTLSDL